MTIMADSEQTATNRIQMILEFLHEREMDIEDLSEMRRVRLEQAVQFCQFQSDASQVLTWIRNGESMLTASFHIPTSLQGAEDMQVEHEQFQLAIGVSLFFFNKFLIKKTFALNSFITNSLLYVVDY